VQVAGVSVGRKRTKRGIVWRITASVDEDKDPASVISKDMLYIEIVGDKR
jgi:hypothetical protein